MNEQLLGMLRALLADDSAPVTLSPKVLRAAIDAFEANARALESCAAALEGMIGLGTVVQEIVSCTHVATRGNVCGSCGARCYRIEDSPGIAWERPTLLHNLAVRWHGRENDAGGA